MLLLDPEFEYLREGAVKRSVGYWTWRKHYLHRLITEVTGNLVVDHINGNVNDNRKENLRICTSSQNCFNSKAHSDNIYSIHKGVSYLSSGKRVKRWRARGYISKEYNLGYFNTEQEAIAVMDAWYTEHHGEFKKK